ncbi:hypothetical protein CSA37_11060 [Candidatus Fermentibacteria bacterium]|nr:MAG: hypothetical protein CSA37_11060 [Candidatus Fermentibacteria bacterium]
MILLLIFINGFPASVNVDSLTASLYIETGMAYLEQGLADRAFREFEKALETSSDAAEAHLGIARVSVLNQAWGDAENSYTTYMELRPDDYSAPLEMAEMTLALRGRELEAAEYADAALSLAPLNGRCWIAVADCQAALGNTEEAMTWYTRTIIESPEFAGDARIKMGTLLFENGDLVQAAEILTPAGHQGEPDAWHILALIYMEQKDALRASDSIRNYLYMNPDGPWADSAQVLLEELNFHAGTGSPGNRHD